MVEEWITHMEKPDLIARIRTDRAKFAAHWQHLTEAQMIQRPGPQADWSVKDLIAHISFWERLMIDTIQKLTHGENPQPLEDADTINPGVFRENMHRALEEVLAEFSGQLELIEAALTPLSEDEINDPQHFAQRDNAPLLYHIIGNTFGHYEEHEPDLLRYIQSLKQA